MSKPVTGTGRIVVGVTLAIAGVLIASTIAAAALSVVVARRVVTPSKKRIEDIKVIAVGENTVTLSANSDTRLPGIYSFWFSQGHGHAKLGAILEASATSVTREVLSVEAGDLATATRGYLAGWVYLTPDDLGLEYEDVVVNTRLGDAPAWLVPAALGNDRWLISVHGRGVRRPEGLRAVEVARRCGYTTLLISYRNDGDAPRSADGLYALGDTEWEDVDSAISFALDRGATEIVLMGWSMGGATVLQTVTRSSRSDVVRGLILESPVVDWVTTLDYQAVSLGIPRQVGRVAEGLLSQGWSGVLTGQSFPVDLDRLDFVARSAELTTPILLLHSADDGFVPPDASRALAEARPDIVTYDEFTVARHTKLWNYDPERWTAAVGTWLSRL
jgi:pimeloyl-ACP methyl ester carboxylesterase